MRSDYQVVLRSREDGTVKYLWSQEQFNELSYNRLWNEIGKISLNLSGSDDLWALFEKDDLIDVERRSPVTGAFEIEDTFFCRYFNRTLRDNEDTIIIGGDSVDHLLKRRLVDPDDDPASAGGYSIKAGFADAVMRELAIEQMGSSASANRQFPDFNVLSVQNVGTQVGDKFRYENLYDVFKDLALRGSVDFKISRNTGRTLQLEIGHFGLDYTVSSNQGFTQLVLLQPEKGNLLNPALTLDYKDEVTVIYALGEGPGNSRLVAKVASGESTSTPYGRLEDSEDFRNLDTSTGNTLISAGLGALTNLKGLEEFTFEIDALLAGTVYRQDWDLYDRISVKWQVQKDYRITGISVSVDANKEAIDIEVQNA